MDYAALSDMGKYAGLFAFYEKGDAADEVIYLGRVMLGDVYRIL